MNRLPANQFFRVMSLLVAFFLLLPWEMGMAVAGQGCPQIAGKTIRWIVPFSPGGSYDAYSRLVAPFFSRKVDAKIRVDNVTGSGGVVGARTIVTAASDGLTMGLINTPGILAAAVTGLTRAPDPIEDLSILGRLTIITEVLVTGKNSPIKSMDDVFELSQDRPLLFAITDVGGTNFVNGAVIASLLDLDFEYVAGYPGVRQSTLAAMRGEVDLASSSFSGVRDRLVSGELRAIMQTTLKPLETEAALAKVPVLGGANGMAASRGRQLGRDPKAAVADANALVALIQSGRLVVAPKGLDPELSNCLQNRLMETLADPEFQRTAAKANRPVQPADGENARQGVMAAMARASKFSLIVKAAIEKARK